MWTTRSSARNSGKRAGDSASVPCRKEAPGPESASHAFAQFLKDASLAIDQSFFYLLQSDDWKSLMSVMALTPTNYTSLLLACEFVQVNNKHDGSYFRTEFLGTEFKQLMYVETNTKQGLFRPPK